VMKNSEEAAEKVLAGLRNSEVPLGLEHRILEAVQANTSADLTPNWRRGRLPWLLTTARPVHTWAWRAALGCTMAISLALTLAYLHGHNPTHSKLPSVSTHSLLAVDSGQHAQNAHLRSHALIMPTRAKTPAKKPHLLDATDSVSLREMRAVSHPAPKAPLTEEEKLLLRIARSGNPHELAMLNPVVRAQQEADEEAEFHEFVEQSIHGNKGDQNEIEQ
jgi:hypothetical protein